MRQCFRVVPVFIALFTATALHSQKVNPAPPRSPSDGGGPYKRLVIRGITVIDGTGASPIGPMDVVIEGNRIVDVVSVGTPHVPIKEKGRPAKGEREIDGTGKYLLPGFDPSVLRRPPQPTPGVTAGIPKKRRIL